MRRTFLYQAQLLSTLINIHIASQCAFEAWGQKQLRQSSSKSARGLLHINADDFSDVDTIAVAAIPRKLGIYPIYVTDL